jgi:hypothetical protein
MRGFGRSGSSAARAAGLGCGRGAGGGGAYAVSTGSSLRAGEVSVGMGVADGTGGTVIGGGGKGAGGGWSGALTACGNGSIARLPMPASVAVDFSSSASRGIIAAAWLRCRINRCRRLKDPRGPRRTYHHWVNLIGRGKAARPPCNIRLNVFGLVKKRSPGEVHRDILSVIGGSRCQKRSVVCQPLVTARRSVSGKPCLGP